MFGIKTKINRLFKNCFCNSSFTNNTQITDLMLAFQADEHGHEANIKNIDLGYGWIHYGLIRQQKSKEILCIGSRHGYIPAILAQACKDNHLGHVDFVDGGFGGDDKRAWTGTGYWKTKKGQSCFDYFGLGKYITLFVTISIDFFKKYPDKTYDYIYIDGDHSYEGVSLDYKLFWPKLKKGGYMVFHDICVKGKKPEGIYGVWKLWKELKQKYGGIEINYSNSGLGIIQK